MNFAELGLIPELLKALDAAGYQEPTPIQTQAIPVILAGHDVMAGAQTGTGKTAGFALPLLQRLAVHANTSASPARHPVRALVLAPTRELAIQVDNSFNLYNQHLPIRTACLYGGVDIKQQTELLRKGCEIVVATPGRLLDHFEQKSLQANQIEFLVLDEADRMLDMGFLPDIRRILSLIPHQRQSLLFSATFSNDIKQLANQILHQPQLIEVTKSNAISDNITHRILTVEDKDKRETLCKLLLTNFLTTTQALIFVDTKRLCGQLADFLKRKGLPADAIHGDKNQTQRNETLQNFKLGKIQVLVATDVAARGLDIDDLPVVINYQLPSNPEDYIHRIGRTGRAGKAGYALSLISQADKPALKEIEKLIHTEITQAEFAQQFANAPSRSFKIKRPVTHVSADGFDFSKPYIPKQLDSSQANASTKDLDKPSLANENSVVHPKGLTTTKKYRPAITKSKITELAFLLGGQKSN